VTEASQPSIYEQMGVRTIINGRGATTAVGGTLMDPEIVAAMAEASKRFVVLEELNRRIGERIAAITGAEAGYVTSGSAAAMALAAAAVMVGTDPDAIRNLPDNNGRPNELVIHRSHRIDYDQMFRLGGGRLCEIGSVQGTDPSELESAISDRTAAFVWIDSRQTQPGALDAETAFAIARRHDVPIIVDAASTLPPVWHLRQWVRRGADLVIYSGGKGIRGPQDSGLLAGRRDLIEAARANGSPNAAIGRGMKASKEAMVGLWVALDRFVHTDHEAERRIHLTEVAALASWAAERQDLRVEVDDDWDRWPAPISRLFPVENRWSPTVVNKELIDGEPSIHLNLETDCLMLSTHCLQDGEMAMIIDRLQAVLDGEQSGSADALP
jgi:D-glucosaminate-6-phosphate ammonia-lyase